MRCFSNKFTFPSALFAALLFCFPVKSSCTWQVDQSSCDSFLKQYGVDASWMQDKVLGQTKDMVLFANTTLQNYAQQKIPDRALNANFMSLVTSWVIPKLLSKKSSMEGDAREGFEYLQWIMGETAATVSGTGSHNISVYCTPQVRKQKKSGVKGVPGPLGNTIKDTVNNKSMAFDPCKDGSNMYYTITKQSYKDTKKYSSLKTIEYIAFCDSYMRQLYSKISSLQSIQSPSLKASQFPPYISDFERKNNWALKPGDKGFQNLNGYGRNPNIDFFFGRPSVALLDGLHEIHATGEELPSGETFPKSLIFRTVLDQKSVLVDRFPYIQELRDHVVESLWIADGVPPFQWLLVNRPTFKAWISAFYMWGTDWHEHGIPKTPNALPASKRFVILRA